MPGMLQLKSTLLIPQADLFPFLFSMLLGNLFFLFVHKTKDYKLHHSSVTSRHSGSMTVLVFFFRKISNDGFGGKKHRCD
jgi:hypothetical protein